MPKYYQQSSPLLLEHQNDVGAIASSRSDSTPGTGDKLQTFAPYCHLSLVSRVPASPIGELTWVEEFFCGPDTIFRRLIAKLYGIHLGDRTEQ